MEDKSCARCEWFRPKVSEPVNGDVAMGYCALKKKQPDCIDRPDSPYMRRLMIMPSVRADHVCEYFCPVYATPYC